MPKNTMERDIICMFDVVVLESSGLHAHLAEKISSDEGDLLYRACEEAQTLLATSGLSPSLWQRLTALRTTFLQLLDRKLGRGHRLCCRLRERQIDEDQWLRLEGLKRCPGPETEKSQYDRLVIDILDQATTCIQDLHPRLLGPSAHRLLSQRVNS
jgi:hypothetical protein